MSNPRFAEYVTSGAFTLNLSRNQISALAMAVGGDHPVCFNGSLSALERKGLVEAIAKPANNAPEAYEIRPTLAGLLVLKMLAEAGLTNEPDPIAGELASLKSELERARLLLADETDRAWSCAARQDAAERQLATFERELAYRRQAMATGGVRLKGDGGEPWESPRLGTKKDRHPYLGDDELRAGLQPKRDAGEPT